MTMAASFLPLEQAIGNLAPLCNMSPSQRAQVLKSAQVVEYPRGIFIFRQGERDGYVYFLLAGTLEMFSDGQLVQEVIGGTTAAAHALAQLQPRQLSARAKTPVSVLRADRALLEQAGTSMTDQSGVLEVTEIDQAGQDGDWMTRLLRSELFSRIPAANIQRIFRQLENIAVHAGDVILRQGAPGDYYYILREGHCAVSRVPGQKGPAVKLAELHPGDTFGEEALVADATRNATVTMLTDGELMRLTKDDFVELIRTPLLRQIDYAEAQRKVAQGAQWLDVRNAGEYAQFSLPQSLNLPLNLLRIQYQKLARQVTYVVVCDDGARSAAAAFLLAERGYDVLQLRNGLNAAAALKSSRTLAETATGQNSNVLSFPPPLISPPVPASQRTEMEIGTDIVAGSAASGAKQLEADVRVSMLHAELMQVNSRLEEALQLKQDAELARLKFEKRTAQELQAERDRLHAEEERAREALAETARLKEELEAAKRKAEEEALKLRQEEEQRLEQLRAEADRRLTEEKQKLETAYAWKEEELTRVLREKQEAEAQLAEERKQLATEKLQARQRLQEARRLQQQLEELQKVTAEEITKRIKQQEELELQLRDEIQVKIHAERHQLETEFARNARQLELAQREREAAEAARQAAAEEAERIVAEYRAAHERWKAEEQARLAEERRHIEREAQRLEENLAAAASARVQAEAARLAAEAHLQTLTALPPATADTAATAPSPEWRDEVQQAEQSISEASNHVLIAREAEAAVAAAIEINQAELARQQQAEQELRLEIQREVDTWLKEQEDLENSDTQRLILANQRENMERIMRSAEAARRAAKEHDQQLLDDLAKRLHPPGHTTS